MSRQYVYVIRSDSGLIKVGVSQNPEVRESQIRAGSGHGTNKLFVAGPFNAATKLEGEIHERLKSFRQFGEWFLCSSDMALSAAKELTERFIDDSGPDEDEARRLREQLIDQLVTAPAKQGLVAFDSQIQKFVSKYEESVNLNANLSAQYAEACELLDWYAGQLKDALDFGRKAVEQIKRLEIQIENLKSEKASQPLKLN